MSSSRGGRGRGRGSGRGKGVRVESEDQMQAQEERALVEAKKHQLIEFVKLHPCLYDITHQEHLNSSVMHVLWEETAEKLGVDGKSLVFTIICRSA